MLQKGFTLIELMIVVAIIGILSMFALPAYQDYTKRTYVSEGFALASGAKLQVTESFASTGVWPADNSKAGMSPAGTITGQSVTGVQVLALNSYNGSKAAVNSSVDPEDTSDVSNILIHYNARVTGDTAEDTYTDASALGEAGVLAIVPVLYADAADQGSIKWVCQKQTLAKIETKWLPTACRAEVAG